MWVWNTGIRIEADGHIGESLFEDTGLVHRRRLYWTLQVRWIMYRLMLDRNKKVEILTQNRALRNEQLGRTVVYVRTSMKASLRSSALWDRGKLPGHFSVNVPICPIGELAPADGTVIFRPLRGTLLRLCIPLGLGGG